MTVHFNPASLQYTVSNTLKDEGSGAKKKQYVSQTTAKLTMDLVFDTTDTGEDVRETTDKMAKLLKPHGPSGKQVPPLVEFGWGVYRFTGMVEQYKETLDFFARERRAAAGRASISRSPARTSSSRARRIRTPSVDGRPHARAGDGADVSRTGGRAGRRRELARRSARRARDRVGQRRGEPALLRRRGAGRRRRRRGEPRRRGRILGGSERRVRRRRIGRRRAGTLGRCGCRPVGRRGLRRLRRRIGRIRRRCERRSQRWRRCGIRRLARSGASAGADFSGLRAGISTTASMPSRPPRSR